MNKLLLLIVCATGMLWAAPPGPQGTTIQGATARGGVATSVSNRPIAAVPNRLLAAGRFSMGFSADAAGSAQAADDASPGVPEPGFILLFGSGLLALSSAARRFAPKP